ncbi:MAG: hypothetical protein ACRCYA_03160 [Cetobacterium sp.]|uniref:hypothetical protein n=1 Tax=Cetobacterium sp. TaxID=2071632 RepID=UPI003F32BA04
MSTKIFGDIETGNYIEVRTKISLLGKRNFANAHKATMSMVDGGVGFKVVSVDLDADIVLLRNALVSITTNKIPKNKGLTLQDIDSSLENVENFEQAIEFLKMENKLGPYAGLENLSKEELGKRRENLIASLKIVNKHIAEKGN